MRRRLAREVALKTLFQVDTGAQPFASALAFALEPDLDVSVREFAEKLARGVLDTLPRLDAVIGEHSSGWSLKRMAIVDRNILRIGCYELLHVEGQPPGVAINEAVELAKKFGSAETPKFVNGVLGAIARQAEVKVD
ncbi:MAG: transcription antitermination factor NusB [Bacillota bacterium]